MVGFGVLLELAQQ
jgi:hypothetical protein